MPDVKKVQEQLPDADERQEQLPGSDFDDDEPEDEQTRSAMQKNAEEDGT